MLDLSKDRKKPTLRKGLILLFFSFLLVLIPISLAQGPPQAQIFTGDVGLELRIPQAEFVQQNHIAQLNIHVYNLSNGLPMTNDTTVCSIHIFNRFGFHTLVEDLNFDEDNSDFFLNIGAGNFSELGFHSFIIQCNTSTIGGFVSGSFDVTADGNTIQANRVELFIYLVIALAIILFVIGLVIQDPALVAISGIMFLVTGAFLAMNGFDGLTNLLNDLIGTVLIAIGAYILVRTSIENFER